MKKPAHFEKLLELLRHQPDDAITVSALAFYANCDTDSARDVLSEGVAHGLLEYQADTGDEAWIPTTTARLYASAQSSTVRSPPASVTYPPTNKLGVYICMFALVAIAGAVGWYLTSGKSGGKQYFPMSPVGLCPAEVRSRGSEECWQDCVPEMTDEELAEMRYYTRLAREEAQTSLGKYTSFSSIGAKPSSSCARECIAQHDAYTAKCDMNGGFDLFLPGGYGRL